MRQPKNARGFSFSQTLTPANAPRGNETRCGFSMVEVMVAVVLIIVVAGVAIPMLNTITRNLRISGDARSINGEIALAKMRAAADFTQARLYADLAANTYHLEVWQKSTNSWVTEGGTQYLSSGVAMGFGKVGTPPSNTQSTMGQSPGCLNGAGSAIANTACIVFNSRGTPIDSTGAPTANNAIYITDGTSVYGVTVSAMALIQTWRTAATNASWMKL